MTRTHDPLAVPPERCDAAGTTTRATVWLSVPLVAIGVAIYYPYSPGGRQQRHIDAAERHIALIWPKIAGDPRFADVDVGTSTSNGGCLRVTGEVSREADVEALRAIVYQPPPTFAVVFHDRPTTMSATRPRE